MTLDEARAHLRVTAAATVDEIRDAFRRRAPALHPDLHPDLDDAARARLGRELHNAREARDILARYNSDPVRKPAPERFEEEPTRPSTRPRAAPPKPAESEKSAPPPRVTMRFDNFFSSTDAAGFGAGVRSPRYVDWARIIVWTSLGLVVFALVAGVVLAANLI